MNCKTQDLNYLLVCGNPKCRREYVGETGIPINLRTNLHRNQINDDNYGKMKMCKHIKKCSKGKFKVFPFYKYYKGCNFYREEMELKFREEVKPELH